MTIGDTPAQASRKDARNPPPDEERIWLYRTLLEQDLKNRRRRNERVRDKASQAASAKEIAQLRIHLHQAESHLRFIRNSLTWRSLRWCDTYFPLLRGVYQAWHLVRRVLWLGPSKVRGEYARATAAGQPLTTIIASLPALPDGSTDPLNGIRNKRMSQGPALLDDQEWRAIEEAPVDAAPLPEVLLRQFRVLRQPVELEDDARPDLFLIDGRALQISFWCGTLNHATQVARILCGRLLERGIPIAFLTSEEAPALPDEFAECATVSWKPGMESRVRAYFRLSPFDDEWGLDLALMRAPWIRRATIWLDAIMGLYPRHFFPHDQAFWQYQLALEKLNLTHDLLSISESSADEARMILGDRPRMVITRCRGAVSPPGDDAPAPDIPFKDYVVVLGNGLPHKNVAAAVAGFASISGNKGAPEGLVVSANLAATQVEALRDMAHQLGLPSSRIYLPGFLAERDFANILSAATAVVIPSLHEGFSLPVVEALHVGTPVILSDIPAHRELLGLDDYFFPPSDPVALGECLMRVVRDPDEALRRQQDDLREHYDPNSLHRSVTEWVDGVIKDWPARQDALAVGVATPVARGGTPSSLPVCKLCETEDFSHPDLRPVIRDVFEHEMGRFGTSFPDGREWRKYWEIAMAVRVFRDAGLLDGQRDFLGIGAGNEPTIFYLTRYARSVLATDLYLGNSAWDEYANPSMLNQPGYHWPFYWRPERLRVAHMDALKLDIPDHSVDAIFSSSSIEHFGDRAVVMQSLDEAYRVLRPGGILSISTEFRLRGDPPGIPGALLFDQADVAEVFVGQRNWELIEPFRDGVSEETRATVQSLDATIRDQLAQFAQMGGYWTFHMRFPRYPHIVLETPTHVFTSGHLALRKTGG